jgi:hypothetical protein
VSTNRRITTVSTENTTPHAEPSAQEVPETWGTPLPPGARQVDVPTQVEMRPHWSARKVLGAVALAVVVVGGGTAVAIAATQPGASTNTHPGAGVSGGQVTGGSGSHHGSYPGGYPGPLGNAVHGDFVVRTSSGAFATERFQTGTVTRLATNSISLTSQDHYVGSYLINASTVLNRGAITIHDVKLGDTVTVIATLSGNTATATTVTDTADTQYPTTHAGNGTGGMQPNDTTSPNPGN